MNQTPPDPVVERIKKLLRMRRGGTPAEIETALRLARDLADKHGLHLDGINPDDDHRASELAHEAVPATVHYDCRFALAIVREFFHCDGVFGRRVLTLVGRRHDLLIGSYAFTFLRRAFARAWDTRDNRKLKNRHAFCRSMYYAIFLRLAEGRAERPNAQSLEVSRQAYLDQLFPNLVNLRQRAVTASHAASRAGWVAGRNTNLRPAVTRTAPLALTGGGL